MKSIGFIDYYLDEWHAAHLPRWIEEATGGEMKVTYAHALIDAPDGLSNREWCGKHGVTWLDSIEAVVERSDYLVVLSPDHPEYHEQLAAVPLASGKPTYIDKTFAPDKAAAIRLFQAAERGGTPMFSSSALRYAPEYEAERNRAGSARVETLLSQGPGAFDNYAIHQLEPIVAVMGTNASRMMYIGTDRTPGLTIEFADGRRAAMHHLQDSPFRLTYQYEEGPSVQATAAQNFFAPFVLDLVRFFRTGKPSVDPAETIAVIALIEESRRAKQTPGKWIAIE